MNMYEQRLAAIAAVLNQRSEVAGPGLIFVTPQEWPAADRAAFAGDDPIARADAIERNSGQRPGTRTKVISFWERKDGPQLAVSTNVSSVCRWSCDLLAATFAEDLSGSM
jgi:hypothetical protein